MSVIVHCDNCGANKLDACHCVCNTRLAEREKEIERLKTKLENGRGAGILYGEGELGYLLNEAEAKLERYREALEYVTEYSNDPGVVREAKAALGEKRHLERRDEGEGK